MTIKLAENKSITPLKEQGITSFWGLGKKGGGVEIVSKVWALATTSESQKIKIQDSTCEMDSINNFLGKSLQTFESTSRSRKFEADRDSCTFIEKSYSQKIKGYYRHKCLAGKEHFFLLAMTLID